MHISNKAKKHKELIQVAVCLFTPVLFVDHMRVLHLLFEVTFSRSEP